MATNPKTRIGLDAALPTEGRAITTPAPRMMITREGERALRAELARLEHQYEEDIVARLREARGFGDGSANDDVLQIQEEEAVLAARIARLRATLETAEVVDEGEGAEDVAAIGKQVEVEDLETGARATYLITDGHRPLAPDTASAGSPVGQALIGHRPGETVAAELPNGRRRRLRIIAVRAAG